MSELKPCPFCGHKIKTQLTDEEGNFRNKEYLNNPYSGVGYVLVHPKPKEFDCPIALGDDEQMGMYSYDTEEGAIEAWNRRAKNATD